MTIKQLNSKLQKRYSLELIRDKYTKQVQCFSTSFKINQDNQEAMDMINRELKESQKLSNLNYLPYFY